MKIGYRTIKTAIGTPIAVSIAQLLGLTNFVSAGILTILCIQPSRKRSFVTAWDRFLACVIASIYSIFFFELLGNNPFALGVMLIVFIPTTVYLNITAGITTSSVIILNLYSASSNHSSFLFDQFLLIIIGIGTALLLNLYMPSLDNAFENQQKKLEDNFQEVLYQISVYIRNNDQEWDGKEIIESEEILSKATNLVERDLENHLLRNKHTYRDYFHMRSRQLEHLKAMLPLASELESSDSLSEKIADFFEKLSKNVYPENTAIIFLNELKDLKKSFNQEELPTTRKEFETRANLFQLLHEVEDYIKIKQKYKKTDVNLVKRHEKSKQ
ncbi:aromatic acid exporter family protein [Oceanobacillus chungangensis]|uniref:Putative aromatic acid exporter C-terminal domain-containing protein n=1 Tax=Oceanobacillus chungangensis TaxID=1229152 RepID=A0A3D8Q1S1_9BACI|nr:aromatic acid exporter family protein [Oceanobacillus chungangensis]RDW21982.1 hypothetical protein CWR45_00385 [Oceanobacillus chungangensis]